MRRPGEAIRVAVPGGADWLMGRGGVTAQRLEVKPGERHLLAELANWKPHTDPNCLVMPVREDPKG